MPREYKVTFEKVAVTATQNLLFLLGASGKMCRLKDFEINCVDVSPMPTDQQLAIRINKLTATATAGSGGSAQTPAKTETGDAAASFTARKNDTTMATTSGSTVTLYEGGGNVKAGCQGVGSPSWVFAVNEAIVIDLITAPSGTVTLSCTATVVETG